MSYLFEYGRHHSSLVKIASISHIENGGAEIEWLDKLGGKHKLIFVGGPSAELFDVGSYDGEQVLAYVHITKEKAHVMSLWSVKCAELMAADKKAEQQAEQRRLEQEALRRKQEEEEAHALRAKLEQEMAEKAKHDALLKLKTLLKEDFYGTRETWRPEPDSILTHDDWEKYCTAYTSDWFANYPALQLDEQQAAAVAGHVSNIQITARAGSGKTRTLVARALFQILHCGIPPASIALLAFNKKAVEEIRERLGEHLREDQMPHVLTFHSLAHRIVKPNEEIVYDAGESKESQVFSTTIQRIIDDEIRNGTLEPALRDLMEERWAADLSRIVEMGFDLPPDRMLELRAMLPKRTMDGRRMPTEAHKNVGNALLRMGIHYSQRRRIYSRGGDGYTPDFVYFNKQNDQRIIIELTGEPNKPEGKARQAYWNSDHASTAQLIELAQEECTNAEATLERLRDELAQRNFSFTPMSDDELWEQLRDDAIRDFTKAVKSFISRCKKELITPDQLRRRIKFSRPHGTASIQIKFWNLAAAIHERYERVLSEEQQTDFDNLMLDAARLIKEGRCTFNSGSGEGNLKSIQYFLIDEFQDFSHLFNELRIAILEKNNSAHFFCVGDDWQAINKFAGSDLIYFKQFSNYFNPATKKLISKNYRSSRSIVEIGNTVMKGEGSPSKANSKEEGHVVMVSADELDELTEAEDAAADELGDEAVAILRIASHFTKDRHEVAILCRNNQISTPEGLLKLEKWLTKLRSYMLEDERDLLNVSTTHGFKGKEADIVILVDPDGYPHIHPDAIFSFIFGDDFDSLEADERRLFYVGVTRPRKALFLLSCPDRYKDSQGYGIKFLAGAHPKRLNTSKLESRLICSGRVVLRLRNTAGCPRDRGTYAIRDQLRDDFGFKWNDETRIWTLFITDGSIKSPYECIEYLRGQPWVKQAHGILASFVWEDQRHVAEIHNGEVGAKPGLGNADKEANDDTITSEGTKAMSISLAGVTYENRAYAIRQLERGETVFMKREPGNSYDPNAIHVVSRSGASLGYIPKPIAATLAKHLDKIGGQDEATVSVIQTGIGASPRLSLLISYRPTPLDMEAAPATKLTASQESELKGLIETRLAQTITELYVGGECPWPVIGYDGVDSKGVCTGSQLEVAWPDFKIGINSPSDDISSFASSGWAILPAATVNVEMLKAIISSASGENDEDDIYL